MAPGSPECSKRNSRTYLPSKVNSGLDQWEGIISQKDPIYRDPSFLKALAGATSSRVTCHDPREKQFWLVALSHGTRVPSLLWAACGKGLSGDNCITTMLPNPPQSTAAAGWEGSLKAVQLQVGVLLFPYFKPSFISTALFQKA